MYFIKTRLDELSIDCATIHTKYSDTIGDYDFAMYHSSTYIGMTVDAPKIPGSIVFANKHDCEDQSVVLTQTSSPELTVMVMQDYYTSYTRRKIILTMMRYSPSREVLYLDPNMSGLSPYQFSFIIDTDSNSIINSTYLKSVYYSASIQHPDFQKLSLFKPCYSHFNKDGAVMSESWTMMGKQINGSQVITCELLVDYLMKNGECPQVLFDFIGRDIKSITDVEMKMIQKSLRQHVKGLGGVHD